MERKEKESILVAGIDNRVVRDPISVLTDEVLGFSIGATNATN